jgi:hypothetical protein
MLPFTRPAHNGTGSTHIEHADVLNRRDHGCCPMLSFTMMEETYLSSWSFHGNNTNAARAAIRRRKSAESVN